MLPKKYPAIGGGPIKLGCDWNGSSRPRFWLRFFAGALIAGLFGPSALSQDLPPVNDIRELRFTANGKYILAQDASTVTVLTVEPFAPLFRVTGVDFALALFSPDSEQLIVVDSGIKSDPALVRAAGERRPAAANLPRNDLAAGCLNSRVSRVYEACEEYSRSCFWLLS